MVAANKSAAWKRASNAPQEWRMKFEPGKRGHLFKFFKRPEYALRFVEQGTLHFADSKRYYDEFNGLFRQDRELLRARTSAVCCFTENEDSVFDPVLWSKYGGGVSGAWVEFWGNHSQDTTDSTLRMLYHPLKDGKKAFVTLPQYVDAAEVRDVAGIPEIKDEPRLGTGELFYLTLKDQDRFGSDEEYRRSLCLTKLTPKAETITSRTIGS
jgi:hypothetical protein